MKKSYWTGAQKAGWFFVGMFGGVAGILIASLSSIGHPDRSTATKMAVIGFAVDIAVYLLIVLTTSCSTAMLISSMGGRHY